MYMKCFHPSRRFCGMANFNADADSWGFMSLTRHSRIIPHCCCRQFICRSNYTIAPAADGTGFLWSGDTFSGAYQEPCYNGIRTLDVAATLDETGKQMTVYAVNQSQDKAQETTITLTVGQFTANVKCP